MAGLRKGITHSRLVRPSYTRKSKYKKYSFVKAVPNHKISRFEMGDKKKQYEFQVSLVSKSTLQLRHNCIESARMIVNRNLAEKLGTNYFFILKAYPHHAIRENKMLGGAHADRLQSGMAHSFGKVTNVAARIKEGKYVMSAKVLAAGVDIARTALKTATPRLPGKYEIIVEKIQN